MLNIKKLDKLYQRVYIFLTFEASFNDKLKDSHT